MHPLDQQMLRIVLTNLERALAALKDGDDFAKIWARCDLEYARSLIAGVLPKEPA